MRSPDWIRDSRVATAAVAVAIGTVAGLFLMAWWARSESGYTIEILGSGDGLSVLITHQHRHVLIASGDDGPEFANAFARAFSPIGRDIELVLIDGNASDDVIDKVNTIESRHILLLAESNAGGRSTVEDSMTISFADNDILTIALGSDGNWIGTLTVGGNEAVTITSTALADPASNTPILIALDGHAPLDAGYAAIIVPAGDLPPEPAMSIAVDAGQSLRINLTDGELRIPSP